MKKKKNDFIELFYYEDKPGVYRKDEEGKEIPVSVMPHGATCVLDDYPTYESPAGIKVYAEENFAGNEVIPNAYVKSGPYYDPFGPGQLFVNFYLII